MVPRRSRAPCSAGTACSGPSRSRIGARTLRPVGGVCSTMQIAASRSAGSLPTSRRSASTPPADAATATTRRGRACLASTHRKLYALVSRSSIRSVRVVIWRLPSRGVPSAKRLEVNVGERTLSLSNLDKLMYPRAGFTKGAVIDYCTCLSPVLLPHLRARPLTLKRYPNGVEGTFFYEKRCPAHRPAWVRTASVWSGRNEGDIDYCLCEDLPTIVWLANLADLELHTPLARAPAMDQPTLIAFDLDPGPPATIAHCARVALELRSSFEYFGLQAFAKTSGSKGMQVYLPLNTPVGYEQTRAFSRGLAQVLERRAPERVVSDMAKAKRAGKVFVDWSQNDRHKTTVNVYSLRSREQPTVSTPLTWAEVSNAADGTPCSFVASEVLERVETMGDLFAPVQTLEQELPG